MFHYSIKSQCLEHHFTLANLYAFTQYSYSVFTQHSKCFDNSNNSLRKLFLCWRVPRYNAKIKVLYTVAICV